MIASAGHIAVERVLRPGWRLIVIGTVEGVAPAVHGDPLKRLLEGGGAGFGGVALSKRLI